MSFLLDAIFGVGFVMTFIGLWQMYSIWCANLVVGLLLLVLGGVVIMKE